MIAAGVDVPLVRRKDGSTYKLPIKLAQSYGYLAEKTSPVSV